MRLFKDDLSWSLPKEMTNEEYIKYLEGLFGEISPPSASLEDWRYGEVDELDLRDFRCVNPQFQLEEDLLQDWMTEWSSRGSNNFVNFAAIADFKTVVFRGFQNNARLSIEPRDLYEPLVVELSEPFETLSKALSPKTISLEIGEFDRATPAFIALLGPSDVSAVVTRDLEVVVPDGKRASVVIVREGGSRGDLYLDGIRATVGKDSTLELLILQNLNEYVWDITSYTSNVASGGSLSSLTVSLGSNYSRLRTSCNLLERAAQARLKAAYIAGGDQTMEFRTFQNHMAPNTSSDLLYKGAVAGSSHSIYSGLIKIQKGARGSNAFQTNRNIVLSERSRADSVPNLDIEESDVKCSHASAVGPVDPEQRFYLESKGIKTEVAEKMIVSGFFRDLFGSHSSIDLSSLALKALEKKW